MFMFSKEGRLIMKERNDAKRTAGNDTTDFFFC